MTLELPAMLRLTKTKRSARCPAKAGGNNS